MRPRVSSDRVIAAFIADENPMAGRLLASSLERKSRFEVVGCEVTVEESLRALDRNPANVAIVSVNLKDGPLSGFELLRKIRQAHPRTHVILLLDSSDRTIVVDAFRAGVRGVFCRSQSFKLLCKCIKCVHEGQIWADTHQMQFVVESLTTQDSAEVVNAKGESLLTKRQKEIVACVADGLTNREIAKQLNLSEHTVKNYLFRICDKVGTSGRVELALYALAHGEFSGRPANDGDNRRMTPRALDSSVLPAHDATRPSVPVASRSSSTLSKEIPFGNRLTELLQ